MDEDQSTRLELTVPPSRKHKHYLVSVTEHNVEQEYSHTFLMRLGKRADAWKVARRYCRNWYGKEHTGKGFSENSFDCLGGQITIDLDSIKEIPESHFLFLEENGYNGTL